MRNKGYLLLCLLAVIAFAGIGMGACSTGSRAEEKAEVMDKAHLIALLDSVSRSGKTMFGHHDDPVYGHTWCGDSGRSDVLEIVGDYPAIMGWDLGRIELGDSVNIDGIPFDRIRSEVRAHSARGGINAFSWHLWNPVNGKNSWDTSDSTTVTKILNDSVVNKAFRAQVAAAADFLNSLTDADGNKIGVIFRPWHEHTGGWFFWGKPYCTPEEYKALWHLTREVLDSKGVDNLLYAYSPDRVTTAEEYLERYPGDDYIDILGADIYHFNGDEGTEAYRNTVSTELSIIRDEAAKRGKFAAFTETGCEGLVVENWYSDILLPLLKENPMTYVIVWRNAHDKPNHFYAPYPGHPSEASFKDFYNDSIILFNKDI